jgi:hypothetical protein
MFIDLNIRYVSLNVVGVCIIITIITVTKPSIFTEIRTQSVISPEQTVLFFLRHSYVVLSFRAAENIHRGSSLGKFFAVVAFVPVMASLKQTTFPSRLFYSDSSSRPFSGLLTFICSFPDVMEQTCQVCAHRIVRFRARSEHTDCFICGSTNTVFISLLSDHLFTFLSFEVFDLVG